MRRWSLAGDSALNVAGLEAMSSVDRRALAAQYERIFEAYGPALVRLTASYEAIPQAREDLLQEILLAIWRALPSFRGDCSEKTFAFRVAHNPCLTHVWRRGKSPESEAELPEVPDPRKNPETLAIDSRRRETLLAAIRALPVNYRQVITLALEDLTPVEIAAVLGVTENNVAVRLNRARKALRIDLGGSTMNMDLELAAWRTDWQAPQTSDAAMLRLDLRRLVERKRRNMALGLFGQLLFGAVLLAFSAWFASTRPTLEWILWAAVIWAGTFFAAGFAVWNKAGTWKAWSQSNAAFLDLSRQRCLRELRRSGSADGFWPCNWPS